MKHKISEKSEDDWRYERKFVVQRLTLNEIEHIIKHTPHLFSEIFYERKINNIYFDSIDFNNYKEHISGTSQRLKIRIRWYGNTFGLIKEPVLELKIKNNELNKKKSFPLKPFVLDKKLSLKLLQKVFLKSKLPEWLNEQMLSYQPTLVNFYKRKYFESINKRCRITIDRDQNFFRIKNKNNLFIDKTTLKDYYVIEVKHSLKDSLKDFREISNITKYFPFRLVANSKYIGGVNLVNL